MSERRHPLEIALLALPFIALTPNFFLIPDLSYQGNATQEVALTWAIMIFLGIALISAIRQRSFLTLNPNQIMLLTPLALFLLWQFVSLLWAPEWAEAIRVSELWFGFAVFFATALLTLSARGAERLHYSLTVVVFILAGSQLLEYWQYQGHMLGVFFSHGITTELLALILPLQITTYLTTKKRWLAVVSLVAIGAGGIAILLTLRRGALLGLTVALVAIAAALILRWLRPQNRGRLIIAGVAIAILFAGLITFKREALIERFRGALQIQTATVGRVTELGLTSRLAKWLTAWEMAKLNPILGIGHGGFTAQYGAHRRYFVENPRYAAIVAASEAEDFDEVRSPHAHNEYLQISAELGLIGLFLFATFWVMLIRYLWQARQSPESAWIIGSLSGLIAFGISSAMSAFSFRYSPGAIISACIAGLGCAMVRAAQSAESTENGSRQIPKAAAVACLALFTIISGGFILRARDVLASQQAQSQLDFRFSLDAPPLNESLVRRYQQVLELDSANSGAHLGLGFLLYQMKRPGEAISHIEYALRHSYSRPYAYIMLAFAYEQTGDLQRAADLLAECLASYPKSLVARAAYIEMLKRQGKADIAVEQQRLLEVSDSHIGRSWLLALRMKDALATTEAKRLGLIPPGELEPMIVRILVQARAYHYLN